MAGKIIKTTFQFRRGTSGAWARVNPVLADGEPGYEKDTGKLKIGDGSTAWNELDYFGGSFEISIDGKSIKTNQGNLELDGYFTANVGQIPYKSANGLDWKNAPEAITNQELQEIFNLIKEE